MPPSNIVDAAVFADLQASVGADFVVELVQTFLEEAPRMLDEMQAALTDGSAAGFRRAAHSLKTNALTFGATQLADRARELELGGLPGDASALVTLQGAYASAAAALQEMSRG